MTLGCIECDKDGAWWLWSSALVILVTVTTALMGCTWGNAAELNRSKLKTQSTGNCGIRWKMYLAKAREVLAPSNSATLVVGCTWRNAIVVNCSSEVQVKSVAIVVHNEKCTWQGQGLCNQLGVLCNTAVWGKEGGNYNTTHDSNTWTMYMRHDWHDMT